MSGAARYDGKPMLRLLDCYVLRAIGHLPPGQAETLERMAPKLSQTFSRTGTWFEMVAAEMEFPPHLDKKIEGIWENGRAKASSMGLTVDAAEFSRQFVDTNFVPEPENDR